MLGPWPLCICYRQVMVLIWEMQVWIWSNGVFKSCQKASIYEYTSIAPQSWNYKWETELSWDWRYICWNIFYYFSLFIFFIIIFILFTIKSKIYNHILQIQICLLHKLNKNIKKNKKNLSFIYFLFGRKGTLSSCSDQNDVEIIISTT